MPRPQSQSEFARSRPRLADGSFAPIHGYATPGRMHPLAERWDDIIKRCTNPNNHAYKNYGGRGIKMCAGWMADRAAFIEDIEANLGPRPAGKTVDRRNNEGHYSCGHCEECIQRGWPFNVRWATKIQNNRNKRNNRRLVAFGTEGCLAEFAGRFGLSWSTLVTRIKKGMTPEQALTWPKGRWFRGQNA